MTRSLSSEPPPASPTTAPALSGSVMLSGLLAVLVALLLLGVAYSARPTVQIDLGTYEDSAFLQGFHAREVQATAAGRAWDWPADRNHMTLPGGLSGDWMATVRAYAHLPGRPVSGVKVLVNGEHVTIPRDSSHQFTAFIPAELAAAEQLTLRLEGTPVGTPDPEPGIIEQVVLQPARTYRWTRGESSIHLPGLGRGAWRLDLDVIAAHPDAQPLDAQVIVNGVPLAMLPESSELRRVSLLVPAALMDSGSLAVTLRSHTYPDPRPLGLLLDHAAVAPLAAAPPGLLVAPPWGIIPASLSLVLALYAVFVISGRGIIGSAPRGTPWIRFGQARHRLAWLPALLAFVLVALLVALLVVGLLRARMITTLMLPGLAGLLLWSLLLLLALRPLLRWALGDEKPSSTFLHTLLLIFFVGYWFKAGGMLYPYFVGIDIHWHMERVRWILDGQLPLLYGTDSPLNESTMPVAEWGSERPVIPYSPYFHMFATGFALLPWPLEFSANMFSALIDCSRVLLIALLTYRVGLGQRAALLAALLYALLPVNFLLHSWGNLPTMFGLWWDFVLTVVIIIAWPRLHARLPFVGLVLVLLAALLIYTVAGVFSGLFLACFTLALWAAAWRSGQGRDLLAGLRPLWLAVAVALVLALLLYYGQYIEPIVTRTLPYFAQALTQSREATGRVSDTLPAYLLRHTRLASYGLVVPLLLTAVYLVQAWVVRFRLAARATAAQPGSILLWAAVAGWVAVMLVFFPLAYKVSLVDKHFFVTIPLLCIASAAVLDRLWQRGWPFRAATLLYFGYLAVSAARLWLSRIVEVRQG